MQLLCEFENVYSNYKYDFNVVELLSHITLKPDVELKKNVSKNPVLYRYQIQHILENTMA